MELVLTYLNKAQRALGLARHTPITWAITCVRILLSPKTQNKAFIPKVRNELFASIDDAFTEIQEMSLVTSIRDETQEYLTKARQLAESELYENQV